MAYVNVAEWKPDQVSEWLKGKILLKRESTEFTTNCLGIYNVWQKSTVDHFFFQPLLMF